MPKTLQLTDKKIGMWTVLGRGEKNSQGAYRWICRCECGNETTVLGASLNNGRSKACTDCRQKKMARSVTTHGMSKEPEYMVWKSMVARTTNPSNADYKYYGARGINIDKRWLDDFECFIDDMGKRPTPSHTIERVDNSKGYSAKNCIWATRKIQGNNTRRNRYITIGGETKTLSQWIESKGLKTRTVESRLYTYGWPIEKALK